MCVLVTQLEQYLKARILHLLHSILFYTQPYNWSLVTGHWATLLKF